MRTAFVVDGSAYRKILDDLNHAGGIKKISAIKTLRAAVKDEQGRIGGLKESKEAIEKLMNKLNLGHYPNLDHAHDVVCGPRVKKITVDFGEGDVEVDLEKMQLTALMQLQSIGLDACGEILDLVKAIQAFSDGYKIGIIRDGVDESR